MKDDKRYLSMLYERVRMYSRPFWRCCCLFVRSFILFFFAVIIAFFRSRSFVRLTRCVCVSVNVCSWKKNCKAHSTTGNIYIYYIRNVFVYIHTYKAPAHTRCCVYVVANVVQCSCMRDAQLYCTFKRILLFFLRLSLYVHTGTKKKSRLIRCDADIETNHVGLAHRYNL